MLAGCALDISSETTLESQNKNIVLHCDGCKCKYVGCEWGIKSIIPKPLELRLLKNMKIRITVSDACVFNQHIKIIISINQMGYRLIKESF